MMDYRLFGVKPLFDPLLDYWRLNPWEQISVKFESKYNIFKEMNLKTSFAKWKLFFLGLNVLDWDKTFVLYDLPENDHRWYQRNEVW